MVFCNFELFSLNQGSVPYSITNGMGGHQPQGSMPYSSTSGTGGHQPQGSVPYSSTSGTEGHQLQGSVPYSITSGTGGHQLQGSVPYSITSGTGGHQLRYNLGHITTIAALRAKESPLGNHFRTTVRPKDLPECWGIKYTCDIDLDSIKRELESSGFLQRRGYVTLPSHNQIAKSGLG